MADSTPVLSPWEQHASAAGLPRFNYNPLTKDSFKGFLVTCTLDREKSATKEAMSILRKYLGSAYVKEPQGIENSEEVKSICKKKKTGNEGAENRITTGVPEACVRDTAENCTTHESSTKPLSPYRTDKSCQPRDSANLKRTRTCSENADDWSGTFLLKMAQKGIISVCWESSILEDPVDVLAKVLKDIESCTTATPRWCQRMIPVQASCIFVEESLSALVMKLVREHVGDTLPTKERPLKYAVSYNRRGTDSTSELDGPNVSRVEALDRVRCIHLVAEAVASAAVHTAVDLSVPQMVIIVEIIPVAGVQASSPVCGVAVVSGTLMNSKPRLCVKPLVPASQRSMSRPRFVTKKHDDTKGCTTRSS